MDEALRLARDAGEAGEVPVGCVVVRDGELLGRGRNRLEEELESRSPEDAESVLRLTGTAHAPLRVEAFTSASRWNPRYTMDLNSSTGEITTRMFARARQKTGLDYAGPLTFPCWAAKRSAVSSSPSRMR